MLSYCPLELSTWTPDQKLSLKIGLTVPIVQNVHCLIPNSFNLPPGVSRNYESDIVCKGNCQTPTKRVNSLRRSTSNVIFHRGGPRTDPCGHPLVISLSTDSVSYFSIPVCVKGMRILPQNGLGGMHPIWFFQDFRPPKWVKSALGDNIDNSSVVTVVEKSRRTSCTFVGLLLSSCTQYWSIFPFSARSMYMSHSISKETN